MPNPARILDRMRTIPADFTVSDLRTVLEYLGWDIRMGKGHLIARSPQGQKFTIGMVKGKKVKQVYLRMLIKEIDLTSND